MDDAKIEWPKMELTPVGQVRSEIKTAVLQTKNSDLELQEKMETLRENQQKKRQLVSELVIFRQWEELLDGIEGFSHVLVLYWPHLIDPQMRHLKKVHPMGRKDLPIQGIFATCSPVRPNPILVSAVRLLERQGNILKVEGLEALDGSLIIDLKPYSTNYYGAENPTVPDWMAQIQRELSS